MNDKAGKVIKYLLSLAVAAVLVYLAFRGTDWRDFFNSLAATDWWLVILSMIAGVVALVFRAERWRSQLLALDTEIGRHSVWHGSNIGNFLNVVVPGIGEFYRCAHVSTKKASYDKTLGTILMERSWDVLAIVFLLVLAAVLNTDTIVPFMKDNVIGPFSSRFDFSLWWVLGAFAVVLVIAFAVVFRCREKSRVCGRLAGWICGMARGFAAFGKMRRKGLFVLYTVGIWMMYIFVTYLTFLALPGLAGLTFADAIFISAIGNIASVIPTPGNIGPYHYLVGLAISTIYLGSASMTADGLLCATLSHGSHAILVILLGVVSYLGISFSRKQQRD